MTGNGFISFVQNEGLGLEECSVETAWKEEGSLSVGYPAVGCSPSVLASVTRVEGH